MKLVRLGCDIVTYLDDRNLFSAYSYDKNTGKYGSEYLYQYKDGKLMQVKESAGGKAKY